MNSTLYLTELLRKWEKEGVLCEKVRGYLILTEALWGEKLGEEIEDIRVLLDNAPKDGD